MAVEVEVTGADQFARLARACKEAGSKGLRQELFRGVNRAVKPIRADIKTGVSNYMPDAYATKLAPSLQIRVRRRTGRDAGVSVMVRAKGAKKWRYVGPLDRGQLKHPLFRSRKRWYVTRIRAGFFTEPVERGAPEARKGIQEALDEVAAKIARGV